ncbi:MAG: hypothetical protein GWP08_21350 [Nitrospiraceae bacterium]|nr:hypothetical protein [Nitrospiraceae bacterium]
MKGSVLIQFCGMNSKVAMPFCPNMDIAHPPHLREVVQGCFLKRNQTHRLC